MLVLTVEACSLEESDDEPSEGSPAVSRDGRRIAFTSKDAIHVAVPGTAARRITDPGEDEFDGSPEWSPDRSRIVFHRVDETKFQWSVLYVVDAAGSGLRRLVEDGEWPTWSPEGKNIAFERFGLPGDVHMIDVDGTNERLLLRDAGEPAWSPDGSKIAVVQGIGEAVAVFDLKTKRVTRVIRSLGSAHGPAWSPDGRRIAFADTPSDYPEIYIVGVDGAGLRRLTRNSADDSSPVWTRDGRIVFSRWPENGPMRLYVMNSDGSGVRRFR